MLTAAMPFRYWIVTPSFNSLPWLPFAVASVADQTGKGVAVHHHVQDGGSTDGTKEWLEQYAAECARNPKEGYTFSYESAADNGMYDAINKGWSLAPRGVDYMGHLNSDEQYLPGGLRTVAEVFQQHPQWEVVLAGMVVTDALGRYICHRRSLKPSNLVFRYTTGGMTAATIQRASVFQTKGIRFDPEWRIIADKVWYSAMAGAGVVMGNCDHLISAFTETGNNLGWSTAVEKEARLYAARYLKGGIHSVNLFTKWNGLRRIVKESFLKPPQNYAIYTGNSLLQRQQFGISKPTVSWGKKTLPTA